MSLSDLDNSLISCSHFPLPLTQTIINPGPKQVNYNMNTQHKMETSFLQSKSSHIKEKR